MILTKDYNIVCVYVDTCVYRLQCTYNEMAGAFSKNIESLKWLKLERLLNMLVMRRRFYRSTFQSEEPLNGITKLYKICYHHIISQILLICSMITFKILSCNTNNVIMY